MNHTKEPWRVSYDDIGYIYVKDTEDDYVVAGIIGNTIEQQEANAQRIVACVNACAGMEDPEKEIAQLKADKAELLKEYKELVKECLNNFVYIPEGRMTAEEYYWQELEFIEKMETGE